jgi:3-oxoacid CoA-transferase subunit B
MMEHVTRDGTPKILDEVDLPLTGRGVVDRIITDLAVLDVLPDGRGLILRETAPGIDVATVQAATGTALQIDPAVRTMQP